VSSNGSHPNFAMRAYVHIDSMQPEFAAYVGATVQGSPPVAGMAELWLEVAPANEVFRVMDIALKAAEVQPATQFIEREFGLLEVHAYDQSAVRAAADAIFAYTGLSPADRAAPQIASTQVITNVDPYQAQLINKMRRGSLIVPGQTLLIMEVEPAAYIALAANEAEKAAAVQQVQISNVGRFGRYFAAGSESEIEAARLSAIDAIEAAAVGARA
jgi:ethanolamine utilization microcompartment shell protein EutL